MSNLFTIFTWWEVLLYLLFVRMVINLAWDAYFFVTATELLPKEFNITPGKWYWIGTLAVLVHMFFCMIGSFPAEYYQPAWIIGLIIGYWICGHSMAKASVHLAIITVLTE